MCAARCALSLHVVGAARARRSRGCRFALRDGASESLRWPWCRRTRSMRAAGQGPGRCNVNAADYAATAPGDAAKMLRDIVLRAIARLCELSRACDMSAVV